ncbi:hypothetical protein IW262DRAFT_1297992 [Armillaria fumosa]|nr:hypothetical protein IW262DRAFT_1297992 [Armillaria fumosa]
MFWSNSKNLEKISKSWIPDPSYARALRKLKREKAKAVQAAERLARQWYHLEEVAHDEVQIVNHRKSTWRTSSDLEEEIRLNQEQQEDITCICAENSSPEPEPSISTFMSSAQPSSNFIEKLNLQPHQNPPSNQNSNNTSDYLNYCQEIQAKSNQVEKDKLMSNMNLDVLWKRMRDHLSSTPAPAGAAARSSKDPWTLEQVFEARKHVLKGPGAVYNDLFNLAVVQVNPVKKVPVLNSKPGFVNIKQEPTVNKSLALPEELTSYLTGMADSNQIMTMMLEKQIKEQKKWDEEMQRTLA